MRCCAVFMLVALSAVAPVQAGTTLDLQGQTLLQFDSRYYPMSPGQLTVEAGSVTVATPVAMSLCRRESGLPQNVSLVRFFYGDPEAPDVIELSETSLDGGLPIAEIRYEFGTTIVRMVTKTGDLLCNGAVLPFGIELLHTDGFEDAPAP